MRSTTAESVLPTRSVGRSTVLATAGTAVGYAATVVQQVVHARALGVNADTDALAAALAWALALTGLIGTTLASVFVPAYFRAGASRSSEAARLMRGASGLAVLLGLAATIGTLLLARPLAMLLLPGGQTSALGTLETLLQITAPGHLLWVGVITAMAVANAKGRFLVAAGSTAVPSLAVTVALVASPTVRSTAVAFVIGLALQMAVIAVLTGPPGRRLLRPDWAPDVWRGLLVPSVLVGLTYLFINGSGIVVRALSSIGAAGQLAAFDYAMRLSIAAETVVAAGGLAVILTFWSEDANGAEQRLPIGRTLAVSVALAAGVAIAAAVCAPIVVQFLFEGGRFRAPDTAAVAALITLLAPGIAARVVHMVAMRALLARQEFRSLMLVGVLALLAVGAGGWVGLLLGGLHGVAAGYSAGWLLVAVVTVAVAVMQPNSHRGK